MPWLRTTTASALKGGSDLTSEWAARVIPRKRKSKIPSAAKPAKVKVLLIVLFLNQGKVFPPVTGRIQSRSWVNQLSDRLLTKAPKSKEKAARRPPFLLILTG